MKLVDRFHKEWCPHCLPFGTTATIVLGERREVIESYICEKQAFLGPHTKQDIPCLYSSPDRCEMLDWAVCQLNDAWVRQ